MTISPNELRHRLEKWEKSQINYDNINKDFFYCYFLNIRIEINQINSWTRIRINDLQTSSLIDRNPALCSLIGCNPPG